MNVNGNFKDNLMGKKKVIFIGCLIFAVALIAAVLKQGEASLGETPGVGETDLGRGDHLGELDVGVV